MRWPIRLILTALLSVHVSSGQDCMILRHQASFVPLRCPGYSSSHGIWCPPWHRDAHQMHAIRISKQHETPRLVQRFLHARTGGRVGLSAFRNGWSGEQDPASSRGWNSWIKKGNSTVMQSRDSKLELHLSYFEVCCQILSHSNQKASQVHPSTLRPSPLRNLGISACSSCIRGRHGIIVGCSLSVSNRSQENTNGQIVVVVVPLFVLLLKRDIAIARHCLRNRYSFEATCKAHSEPRGLASGLLDNGDFINR